MFVKPAVEGTLIRIPERDMRPMLAEGEDVPETQFWYRRILFGDVVKVESVPVRPEKNKEMPS